MFQKFTSQELIDYIKNNQFKRQFTQLHIHHTWLPDYSDFSGNNHQYLQQNMKDWEKAISVMVELAKDSNIGELDIFQYLPQLIENIHNSK